MESYIMLTWNKNIKFLWKLKLPLWKSERCQVLNDKAHNGRKYLQNKDLIKD